MHASICHILLVISLLPGLAACTGQPAAPATSSPTPRSAAPATSRPASDKEGPGKTAKEQRFDDIEAEGKKEGMVVAISALAAEPRQALMDTVKKKYGIDMGWLAGKGSETVVKVSAERRAGIYSSDIILAGADTQRLFKEGGFLQPLDDVLMLPEVTDPRMWMDGHLPFLDPDHMMIGYFAHAASSVLINTDLVKPEEIASYRDLLAPKWKGKIVMQDPTVSGAGNAFFGVTILGLLGEDFAYQLAQQEPLVMRDQRLALEWIARGKYPIMLAPDTSLLGELVRAGAPLKHTVPKEGIHMAGGSGGVALLNNAPHPNASILLLNWLLTKEGQTVMAKAQPDQSRRVDVSNEYIDASKRLDPKVKYIDADEEQNLIRRMGMTDLAKKIFGPYMR